MNWLNFYSPEKYFISWSFMCHFGGYSILDRKFSFSFITLEILSHFLLACNDSAEKPAVSLMGVLLKISSHFSLQVCETLSLLFTLDSFAITCSEEDLNSIYWSSLSFLFLNVF